MGETVKAHARRTREGWHAKWLQLDRPGIDLGCEREPISPMFRRWDLIYGDGDAIDLSIFPDESWWTVYAAHLLEHIADPVSALREWYRVLHPDGRLIVNVPSMELYEGQTYLPSRWNADHRTFWMPEFVEPGQPKHIRGLRQTIMEALPSAVILDLRVLNEGHLWPSPEEHPLGEYSIEAIIGKGKK